MLEAILQQLRAVLDLGRIGEAREDDPFRHLEEEFLPAAIAWNTISSSRCWTRASWGSGSARSSCRSCSGCARRTFIPPRAVAVGRSPDCVSTSVPPRTRARRPACGQSRTYARRDRSATRCSSLLTLLSLSDAGASTNVTSPTWSRSNRMLPCPRPRARSAPVPHRL